MIIRIESHPEQHGIIAHPCRVDGLSVETIGASVCRKLGAKKSSSKAALRLAAEIAEESGVSEIYSLQSAFVTGQNFQDHGIACCMLGNGAVRTQDGSILVRLEGYAGPAAMAIRLDGTLILHPASWQLHAMCGLTSPGPRKANVVVLDTGIHGKRGIHVDLDRKVAAAFNRIMRRPAGEILAAANLAFAELVNPHLDDPLTRLSEQGWHEERFPEGSKAGLVGEIQDFLRISTDWNRDPPPLPQPRKRAYGPGAAEEWRPPTGEAAIVISSSIDDDRRNTHFLGHLPDRAVPLLKAILEGKNRWIGSRRAFAEYEPQALLSTWFDQSVPMMVSVPRPTSHELLEARARLEDAFPSSLTGWSL